MAKVVVVYHSGYGHTQRVAQQVARGADAELLAIFIEEAHEVLAGVSAVQCVTQSCGRGHGR